MTGEYGLRNGVDFVTGYAPGDRPNDIVWVRNNYYDLDYYVVRDSNANNGGLADSPDLELLELTVSAAALVKNDGMPRFLDVTAEDDPNLFEGILAWATNAREGYFTEFVEFRLDFLRVTPKRCLAPT